MTKPLDDQLLYSVEQACAVLGGISRSTLYELMADGGIKRVKVGRRTYFTRPQLERFVATALKNSE